MKHLSCPAALDCPSIQVLSERLLYETPSFLGNQSCVRPPSILPHPSPPPPCAEQTTSEPSRLEKRAGHCRAGLGSWPVERILTHVTLP